MNKNMKTSDFHFDLPENLIAQTPLKNRAASRLFVMDPTSGSDNYHFAHRHFSDILEYLNPGDCLVINETKVIPARLIGAKPTGAAVELLLLERKSLNRWTAMVRPGRKMLVGARAVFGEGRLTATVLELLEGGTRLIEFAYEGIFEHILEEIGQMPLPPYITEKLNDKPRYNTVYAKNDGSAAAPTAGLHFTDDLLGEIVKKGVKIARLTLHVGLGTFRPVKAEMIKDHHMHSERYEISADAAKTIAQTKANGGRVIAVGTTSARTLEGAAVRRSGPPAGSPAESPAEFPADYSADSLAGSPAGSPAGYMVKPGTGETDIFIYPGYKFKMVDALITNFHLPESTLIMLVSAFAGRCETLRAYREAVEKEYRFFSFGDAMFINGPAAAPSSEMAAAPSSEMAAAPSSEMATASETGTAPAAAGASSPSSPRGSEVQKERK